MSSWFVIGVSGVSCAGKTSLSHSIRDFLLSGQFAEPKWNADTRVEELRRRMTQNSRIRIGHVEVLHQDDYFLPEQFQEDVEVLGHKNWELITGIDMKRMCADIENVLRRDSTFQHSREGHIMHTIINILIVEGFTIFANPFVLELCTLKLHMHLPYEKCLDRRKLRSYDPPDVVGYFEMCVWPEYEKYFRERIKERKEVRLLNGELPKLDLNVYVMSLIVSIFKL